MRYFIWLMAAADEHALWQTMIDTLAARLQSPVFEAHCTLGTLQEYPTALAQRLQHLAQATPAFTVASAGISRQPHFYQRMMLHLDAAAPLLDLQQQITQLGATSTQPYQPHVSLVYGAAPEYRLDQVAPLAAPLQRQRWRMDHIAVVRSHPIVERWQVIERLPLGHATPL